jgi:hypothetical protein
VQRCTLYRSSHTLEVSAARSGCVSLALGMGMPMSCVGATSGGITMPCGTHAVRKWPSHIGITAMHT